MGSTYYTSSMIDMRSAASTPAIADAIGSLLALERPSPKTSALYLRYIGAISALYRLYIGTISALYWLYIGSISALYRLYIGPISALYRPYIGPISALYWLYIGHRRRVRLAQAYL